MFHLRPYAENDFDAAMDLWLAAWQAAYPGIDFHERLEWWKQRWLNELLPTGEVIVATDDEQNMMGFVTLTPATGYLDQIVVAPAWQGSGLAKALLDYAKGRSEGKVTLHVNQSNVRALHFYKREGFSISGESVNSLSGLPVYEMEWQKG